MSEGIEQLLKDTLAAKPQAGQISLNLKPEWTRSCVLLKIQDKASWVFLN